MRIVRSRLAWILLVASMASSVGAAIGLIDASPAGASYNRSAAASYQSSWWNGYNSFYDQFTDDCANYVSQVLAAGTLPQNSNWYFDSHDFESSSWINSQLLYNYLEFTSGEAYLDVDFSYWLDGSAPGLSGQSLSDPFFYNWTSETNGEGDTGISHATIIHTLDGTDGQGYVGNLVSSHTTPRENLFWTEKDATDPSNAYWTTEEVFGEHITY